MFGRITRQRYEVVIEGADDEKLSSDTIWKEYEFKAKAGDPHCRPRQVATYHLRLDWLMWFVPLAPSYAESWFLGFLLKLLDNDPDTVKLLARNPFPRAGLKFVRVRLYRYRYTTRQERRTSGAWWSRTLVSEYLPPLTLRHTSTIDPGVEAA